MGKCKEYTVSTPREASNGVTVTYQKRRRKIRLRGWFDHIVGTEPLEVSLGAFLTQLNISLDDIQKALAEQSESEKEQN
jgi:hypothetical protein